MANSGLLEHIMLNWPVDEQFEAAKALAANCGYDLVEQTYDARKDHIRRLIKDYSPIGTKSSDLIIEGLEALLK